MIKSVKSPNISLLFCFIIVSCLFVSNSAMAVTYDLTGTWVVTNTNVNTTCAGWSPIAETNTKQGQQSGTANTTESWSLSNSGGTHTISGTVTGAHYTGGNTWASGPIGNETTIVSVSTSTEFTLSSTTAGSGTETDFYLDQFGSIVCQDNYIISLHASAATHTTASSTVNNPQILRTTTTNIINIISKRIQNTISHTLMRMVTDTFPVASDIALDTSSSDLEYGISAKDVIANQIKAIQMDISNTNLGLSAGSSDQRMGVWGNIALTFSENDLAATASEIDIKTYIAGFDMRIFDDVVTGIAVSFDNTDATNTYNAGDLDADSYSLVPYISFLINDNLSMEALYGHSWVDTDQVRNSNVSSSPTSRKDFLSASFNAYKTLKNINYTGNMTYTWAKEVTEGFNEVQNGTVVNTVASQRTKFSQFSLGLELSYLIKQFEPYASIIYENDITHTDIAGVAYDNVITKELQPTLEDELA